MIYVYLYRFIGYSGKSQKSYPSCDDSFISVLFLSYLHAYCLQDLFLKSKRCRYQLSPNLNVRWVQLIHCWFCPYLFLGISPLYNLISMSSLLRFASQESQRLCIRLRMGSASSVRVLSISNSQTKPWLSASLYTLYIYA